MTDSPAHPLHHAALKASFAALVLALAGCATTGFDTAPSPAAPPETAALPASAATPMPPVAALPAEVPVTLAPLPTDLLETPTVRPDPLRTLTGVEVYDPDARSDLWQRVRGGLTVPDLDNELVRKWEQYYASRPDYVQRMTERGGRYLFFIVEEVERRGMPSELALLPFIESGFNPQAMSSARASGMWQFMPATGKEYELKQNMFRDDRRDVLASTRAALDYLQMLHGMFGNWHHALAAYNWGQGSVQRAIARNTKAGLPTDYDNLRMPAETRNYVPKLQAIENLVLNPELHGVTLPALENHPFFLSVAVERDIDVAVALRLSGLSLEEFQQLNPQMNKPVILAAGTPQLLMPYDNANRFVRAMAEHTGPLATWTAWVAPRTLKPADAAKAVGVSEAQLREVNKIPPRMLVRAGSTLLVPRAADTTKDVAVHLADNAAMLLSPESRPAVRRTVRVGPKGETVASVARRYRVSTSQLAKWNGVATSASFRPGQAVVLVMPAAKPRAVAKAAPSKRSSRKAAPTRTRVAQR
jgi:membrane-bound lytic murein transglycosylase D